MLYRLAADAVLLLHLAFILFVLLGALLAFRWRWVMCIHLPAAAWGVWIELSRGACPLTDWENLLLRLAGQAGYADSFVEHYLLALIYPAGLTRGIQLGLAGLVLIVNLALYARLWRTHRKA